MSGAQVNEKHRALARESYSDVLYWDAKSEKSGTEELAQIIADAEARGRDEERSRWRETIRIKLSMGKIYDLQAFADDGKIR